MRLLKASPILISLLLSLAACSGSNSFQTLQDTDVGVDVVNVNNQVDEWNEHYKQVVAENEKNKTLDKSKSETSSISQTNTSSESTTPEKSDTKVNTDGPVVNKDLKITTRDIQESGFIKPTIYYFPFYDEDKKGCDDAEKVYLHDAEGNRIIRVCKKSSASCGLQGTCSILQKGKLRLFNIFNRINGQDRYFEINEKQCPYGYGVKGICLDPFHTVAADLKIYSPGDVIFVPGVMGTVLPDGQLHDGFFVVRDKGRGIKGKGRFDFYTGMMSWLDEKNPFSKLGLGDKKTAIPYYKIQGSLVQDVQNLRNYPR